MNIIPFSPFLWHLQVEDVKTWFEERLKSSKVNLGVEL